LFGANYILSHKTFTIHLLPSGALVFMSEVASLAPTYDNVSGAKCHTCIWRRSIIFLPHDM